MLEKLTSLTTLNLSNTGVSHCCYGGHYIEYNLQVLSMYIPNMEKLQSLSDVNLSHNELTRSKYALYFMK